MGLDIVALYFFAFDWLNVSAPTWFSKFNESTTSQRSTIVPFVAILNRSAVLRFIGLLVAGIP